MGAEGNKRKRREGKRKREGESNKNPPSDRPGYGPVVITSHWF